LVPSILDRELFFWFFGEMVRFRNDLEQLREQAHASETVAKKEEQEKQLRARIAAMKGYDDITNLRGDIIKSVDICGSIPKAVREILFHPVWFSRKLEKEFTVVVEKSHDTHTRNDGCWIGGVSKDVDACVSRLESFDISGRKTLLLDGKTISTIMGTGGANAYELEKQFGVIIHAPPGSVELTVFGSEIGVGKFVKRISEISTAAAGAAAAAAGNTTESIITERVLTNACVARALQNYSSSTIEEKNCVSISVSPLVENPRESWVVVRGRNEGVSNAIEEMNRLIKNRFVLETVEAPSVVAVDALLGGTSSKKGMSEIKLAMRFNDLRKKGVFNKIPSTDGGASQVDVCVYDEKELGDVIDELMDILERVVFETEIIDLDQYHSRCWNEAMCLLVSSRAGGDVEVTCRRFESLDGHAKYNLEIWGPNRGIEKAKKLINEVHVSKVLQVPEEVVKPMLENKCQVIQSMQNDAIVSIHFSKLDLVLHVYGLDGNKRMAEKLFSEFVESVHADMLQNTVKTIPIASDEIGRLIGPKGRTMNGIKERSDLIDIRISEIDNKVYLTGSSANIDHAISLIEEELSSRKDASVVQVGLAEDAETTVQLEAAKAGGGLLTGGSGGAASRGLFGAEKTNEWVPSSAPAPQVPVEVSSQELFPSLGSAMGVVSKKKK